MIGGCCDDLNNSVVLLLLLLYTRGSDHASDHAIAAVYDDETSSPDHITPVEDN